MSAYLDPRFTGVEWIHPCICTPVDNYKTVVWSPSRGVYLPGSQAEAGDLPVGICLGVEVGAKAVLFRFASAPRKEKA
jgi:hypothetical protein